MGVDQKLSKKEILRRPEEYRNVYKAGKGISEQGLTLKAQPNSLGYCRLGITVPNRIISKAVARNRLKRHLREIFRLNKHLIKGGCDLVLTLRNKSPQSLDFNQTEELVLLLLKKNSAVEVKRRQ